MQGSADEWFEECYAEHADSIFRFAYAKVSDREVALDLAQESFMRLWDQVRDGAAMEHPRAFLFTVVRNLVIDHYRKKKTASLDAMVEDGREFAGNAASPETDAAYHEALGAILALEEPYRDVVYLRYVEEIPPREVAEVLGESVNAVSIRITRGMKKLRETL